MKRHIDLNEDYGLVPADGLLTITTKGLSFTDAKTKYPAWWNRWNLRGQKVGWTALKIEQTFMKCGIITACANDAFFSRQAHPANIATGASANVIVPWGEYETTSYIYGPIGILKGDGTFAHGTDMGSTVIMPAPKLKWNPEPDFPEGDARYSMGTPVIGTNGILAYAESTEFSHFRFEGNRTSVWHDPTDKCSGLIYAGGGECSEVIKVQANAHNNYGIEVRQGTPAVIGYATVFNNNLAGIGLLGTALSTVQIGTVSADDNPYVFRMVGAPYGEPGGMVDIGLVKLEANTAPDGTPGFKDKDQCVGEVRGQAGVQIDAISAASGNSKSFSLFVVDCRLNNGTPQSCRISVGMCKNINFDNLVVDLFNKKRWLAPTSYQNYSMEYDAANGGSVKVNGVLQSSLPYNHNDRLGVVSGGASYDYVNYLPVWSFEGPGGSTPPVDPVDPPVSCTYTTSDWSEWGPCINGLQQRTRTVAATPPGCVGTPPPTIDERACVVDPVDPPVDPALKLRGHWKFDGGTDNPIKATIGPSMVRRAGGATVSGGIIKNDNANSRWTVSLDRVKKITFTDLKMKSMGYQMLFTTESGRGLIVLPNGSMLDNTDPNNEPVLLSPGTLSVNTPWSGTITLPTPMDIRGFGAMLNQGNGWTGSIGEIKAEVL